MSDPKSPAAENYWHLWTDAEGISRHQLCTISQFTIGRLGPRNSPQFSRDLIKDGNAFVTYLPVGWKADWHENPEPKWIYILRGAWAVTSMDGKRVVMKAGEYSYGGDQGCVMTTDGRFGHLSEQIGDETCVQLIVQRNDESWRNLPPGSFS